MPCLSLAQCGSSKSDRILAQGCTFFATGELVEDSLGSVGVVADVCDDILGSFAACSVVLAWEPKQGVSTRYDVSNKCFVSNKCSSGCVEQTKNRSGTLLTLGLEHFDGFDCLNVRIHYLGEINLPTKTARYESTQSLAGRGNHLRNSLGEVERNSMDTDGGECQDDESKAEHLQESK